MNLNDAVIETKSLQSNSDCLRQFLSSEIFFEITGAPESLENGPMVTGADLSLGMRFANLNGEQFALFFTSRQDARLSGRIGGVSLEAAINIVLENSHVQGMLLQSNTEAWMAFRSEGLAVVSGPQGN